MWNPFKKNTQQNAPTDNSATDKDEKKSGGDSFKMNMLQRIAMKRMEKMGPKERAKLMQDFMKPENRGQMVAVMEMMRKSGQISDEQYELAKKRMGL